MIAMRKYAYLLFINKLRQGYHGIITRLSCLVNSDTIKYEAFFHRYYHRYNERREAFGLLFWKSSLAIQILYVKHAEDVVMK